MRYTVQEIQKIAGAIAARHGVERMFLFGSYARGDAGPDRRPSAIAIAATIG